MFVGGKRISLELASSLLELDDDEKVETPSSIIDSPEIKEKTSLRDSPISASSSFLSERDLSCLKTKLNHKDEKKDIIYCSVVTFEGRKRIIARRDKITNKLKNKINDLYGKSCVNDLDDKCELNKYKKGEADCLELATVHNFDYWKEERRRSSRAFNFISEKLKLFLNFMNWKNEEDYKFYSMKEFIMHIVLRSFRNKDETLGDVIRVMFVENSDENNPLSKLMECSYNCKYSYAHEMLYPTFLIFGECINMIEKDDIKKLYEYYSRGRLLEYDLPIPFISNLSRRFKCRMSEIENMTI